MEKKEIQAITEKKDGKLIAIASTEDKDRAGDILNVTQWDFTNYLNNPVLQAGHDYRPQFTIGIAKNIRIEDKKVLFEPVFHAITPLAKQIKEMYEQGFLKAWSVGFIPGDGKNKANELLEVSAVAVPANANALTMMKSFGEKEQKEFSEQIHEWIKKEVEIKPFPNEHACRLKNPDDFQSGSFRSTTRESEGKTYRIIMGRLTGEETMTEQSYRYNKNDWTIEQAQTHCSNHEGNFEAAKESEEKAMMTVQSSETNGHTHQCMLDEETGDGSTNVVDGHSHKIIEFVMQEADGHTHEIPEIKGEHKKKKPKKDISEIELWNKSLPSIFKKDLDFDSIESNTTFEYKIFSDFLGCQIKEIYVNNFQIPSPLLGSYLSAFDEITKDYQLIDTRNFCYNGTEFPPIYEVIQLNSKIKKDFLVEGVKYYKKDGVSDLIIKFAPNWFGMGVSLISKNSNRQKNMDLLQKAHEWVKQNNYLKGEKFALNGEFLEKTEDNWDNTFIKTELKGIIQKSLSIIKKEVEKKGNRGLLFIGPAGTGKTKTGRVIMNELDSTFIWISSKDMDRVGPITAIKMAFELARDLAPSVLFMEDIDSWIHKTATDLLKTELDGLKQNKGLVTILTSNNPENFPDALIDRPGRFHEIIDFNLPDSELRKSMIKFWLGDIEEKTLEEISQKTEGFSGAYLKELIDFARIVMEDDGIDVSQALVKSLDKILKMKELVNQIRQNRKGFDIIDVIIKEGRVLSKKNKEVIEQARDALNEVLNIADKQINGDDGVKEMKLMSDLNVIEKNVQKKIENKVNPDEIVLKTLQKIVSVGNQALAEKKKQRRQK